MNPRRGALASVEYLAVGPVVEREHVRVARQHHETRREARAGDDIGDLPPFSGVGRPAFLRPLVALRDPGHRVDPHHQRRRRRRVELRRQPRDLRGPEHAALSLGHTTRVTHRAHVRHDEPDPADRERLADRRVVTTVDRIVRHDAPVHPEGGQAATRRAIGVIRAEVVVVPRVGDRDRSQQGRLRRRRQHRIVRPAKPRRIGDADVLVVQVAHVDEQIGLELPHRREHRARRSGLCARREHHAERPRPDAERAERALDRRLTLRLEAVAVPRALGEIAEDERGDAMAI